VFRRVFVVLAVTVCAGALLHDSAAGGWWRHGGCRPCCPCPTCCAPQECPACCSAASVFGVSTGKYTLYFCKAHHWTIEGSPSDDYDALYRHGKGAGRKFRHRTEGCHAGYDGGDFTIVLTSNPTPPPDMGTPAMCYKLYHCLSSGVGGWLYVDESTDYDKLYNEGMSPNNPNAPWVPADCSEDCSGGYGPDYFRICPSVEPCGSP
jgi:hypothetical protein